MSGTHNIETPHPSTSVGRGGQVNRSCSHREVVEASPRSTASNLYLSSVCATAYQSNAFTGGFSETQLDDVFKVRFKGNGSTSRERASDFCLLRCGKLYLQQYNGKYNIAK